MDSMNTHIEIYERYSVATGGQMITKNIRGAWDVETKYIYNFDGILVWYFSVY